MYHMSSKNTLKLKRNRCLYHFDGRRYLCLYTRLKSALQHFTIFIILGNYKGMYRNSLIHAFIFSKLDYCNSLLYGAPNYLLQKMQRVQNAAERESNFCHWQWHRF